VTSFAKGKEICFRGWISFHHCHYRKDS